MRERLHTQLPRLHFTGGFTLLVAVCDFTVAESERDVPVGVSRSGNQNCSVSQRSNVQQ